MPSDPCAALTPEIIERARGIRLLVSDCDGVLTDGGVYYSVPAEVSKRFHIRDGMGVERLRKLAGIDTALVSGEGSPTLKKRAEKLSITECHLGIEDKAAVLQTIAARRGLPLQALAYMGDDVNDLPAMALGLRLSRRCLRRCSGERPHRVHRPRRPWGVPGIRGDPPRGRDGEARLIQRGASRAIGLASLMYTALHAGRHIAGPGASGR